MYVSRILRYRPAVQREIESLPLEQLAVTHLDGWISTRYKEDAVPNGELAHRNIEGQRSQLEQRIAGSVQGLAQAAGAELRTGGLAAGCKTLIGSEAGVAEDDLDAIERHKELLGHQLGLDRRKALSELNLARVDCDALVRPDRDPGINLCRVHQSCRINRVLRRQFRVPTTHAEADNQRAGAFQEIAARGSGVYVLRLHALSFAYRTSARTMRVWA